MFYDEYGFYPAHRDQTACGGWGPRSSSGWLLCGGNNGTWLTSDPNFSKFISKVPVDPINISCDTSCYAEDGIYNYTYSSTDGTDYDLRTLLEDMGNSNRCESKCYNTHPGGYGPGTYAWCANHGSPACGGVPWWDNASQPQIYSDH